MTYNDDPNMPARGGIFAGKGLVLGGLVALGALLAVFMFVGRDSATTTASNTDRPAATTPPPSPGTTGAGTISPPSPGTTGAGSTSPPPASR